MLKMELEYKDEILFARLKGNLNRRSSYKINNYLNPVLKKHNIKYLIYNLKDLKSFDTFGIDAIQRSKKIINENKGKIRICNEFNMLSKFLNIKTIQNEFEAYKLVEMVK